MLVLCNTRKTKGKQNKTKNTGPVVLHTLKPQLTVGKMCPSINAGYLSADQQLIWLVVSLVWTRLSVSPSYWISSPFPHPYKIRMYMYFHHSSFFPYSV